MSGKHSHFENYREVVSYLNGNSVFVNLDPDRFLLFPEERWDKEKLKAEIEALLQKQAWKRRHSRSPVFLAAIKPFLSFPSHETAASTIDAIMSERHKWGQPNAKDPKEREASVLASKPWYLEDKARIREFLCALWRSGAIAIPVVSSEFRMVSWKTGSPLKQLLRDACSEVIGHEAAYVTQMTAHLEDIIMRFRCPADIGDLIPDTLNLLRLKKVGRYGVLAVAITSVQAHIYGKLQHKAEDYWPRHTYQRDMKFSWVESEDLALMEWASFAAEYIENSKSGVANRIQAMRYFFKYLIKNQNLPRSPRDFLSFGGIGDVFSIKSPVDHYNLIVDFFEWVIDAKYSEEALNGDKRALQGFRNPLSKRSKANTGLPESSRDAIPAHILKIMIEVLTENDWSWAKSIYGLPKDLREGPPKLREKTNGADWFPWEDLGTGKKGYTWAPARAVALFAKLRFPARTMQIRTLDFGEGDDHIPDLDLMKMVANPNYQLSNAVSSAQRNGRGGVRSGRKFGRRTGVVQIVEGQTQPFLTMRFTTNKSADINKDSWNKGYTAPWMPEDLARALVALREWQIRYNKQDKPTEWTTLREFKGRKHHSQLAGMANYFLFRDRTATDPDLRCEPIGDGKVKGLWLALSEEVERRLADAGIVGQDGQPIKLVSNRNARGDACSALYDLHALRVTLITHFIEHGEVAPDILMKIVGHATIVMTLYYIKHNHERIAEAMILADAKSRDVAQREWLSAMRSKDLDDLRDWAIAKSDHALTMFRSAPSGSLVPMIAGVCSVGCSRCDQGGSTVNSRRAEDRPIPVPGGRANCAGCRFFVSGEPWLEGVQTEFNVRSYEMTGLTRRRERLEEQFLPLDDTRRTAMAKGRVFEDHREWERLSHQIQEIESRQEQLALEMANLLVLEQQIKGIAKRRMDAKEGGIALVVGDVVAVEAALEESTEWDLADRICRSAVVYPSLAARGNLTEAASEFRARRYDRVLSRNGLDPRFLDLDGDLSSYVGNRMSEWLDMRIGRRNTLRLMDCEVRISDICREVGLIPEAVRQELEDTLDEAIAGHLSIDAQRRAVVESGPRPLEQRSH